jgi:hypothetical protein
MAALTSESTSSCTVVICFMLGALSFSHQGSEELPRAAVRTLQRSRCRMVCLSIGLLGADTCARELRPDRPVAREPCMIARGGSGYTEARRRRMSKMSGVLDPAAARRQRAGKLGCDGHAFRAGSYAAVSCWRWANSKAVQR